MLEAAAFWIPHSVAEGRYRLLASDAACVGIPGRTAPMGGVTTGAAIEAMEHATDCALVWSSAQFLRAAPVETDFAIDVEVVGGSERRPQARATLADEDGPIVIVSGALGPSSEREGGGHTFVSAPTVTAPLDCPLDAPSASLASGGLFDQLERRLAGRDEGAGTQSVWFRSTAGHSFSAGLLAILADFVAGAHADTRGSVGLDNTLRIAAIPETEWVLAQTRIAHIGARLFHGGMEMYSDAGALMAIASLSSVRPRRRTAE